MEYQRVLLLLDEEKQFAKDNFVPIIRPESAKILYDIVARYKPNSILEIGTAIGFSGSIMLSTSDNVVLDTIEIRENLYNRAKDVFERLGYTHRVNQYLGDAMVVLDDLLNSGNKYDFIFLDGPKGQYVRYLPKITNLLNKGGVIVADNVLFMGMVESEAHIPHRKRTIVNNLRKYLEVVNVDPYETELLRVEDGIAITKVKERL